MNLTKTTCPYCGVGCGVLAAADGTIKGDPDHPANYGRLCSKGAALGETIDLSGRLLYPTAHGKRVTWDDALSRVATAFSDAIRDHGPDSVAFYASGQLLTEDYYVTNKLMKGFIGAANIDTNSRLCMASSVVGHKRAFGTDTVPGTYEDLEQADLIVLVGSNLAWCHPVLYQRIAAAKDARPNMRIINIDPRRTATTDLADLHLSIAPDGDIALFNGLLVHLADTGALNQPYIDAYVNGLDAALVAARDTDPTTSGLSPQELQQFFAAWAGTQKVVTIYSQGVNQSTCGSDKVNAILNCHLATGRIGTPGCGPFSVTGQPNAMGGREVGGLANMLANHLDIENTDHRDAVQDFWQSPTICTHAGLKAVDLFQACADGKIKALWVISTNPAASMPDADAVATAIKNVPFVAVSDIMARTDTGDLADVLLPAAGWGEKNGTVTNSERRISRQHAFLPTPGDVRPDWDIVSDVGRRMGFVNAFSYETPAEVFAEYIQLAQATRVFDRDLDLSIFSDADYAKILPTQWPQQGRRFFGDGRFYHADGKAKMVPVSTPIPKKKPTFHLNTGRNRDQWHTMTRTGKAARLGAHLAEPYVEIHPKDATELALKPGDIVELRNLYGASRLRALVNDRVSPGTLFAPMHWTRQRIAGSPVNALVAPGTDPFSGQPALKGSGVTAQRFNAGWYGFLCSSGPIVAKADYTAIARTMTGWQAELAWLDTPRDWTSALNRLTGCNLDDMAIAEHRDKDTVRLAVFADNVVKMLFFVSRRPVVLSRSTAIAEIGSHGTALAALAGRASVDLPDPGPTICACFNVGRNTLLSAVANGATSLDALGASTCAGTNCGSCKPELRFLLTEAALPLAAE